MNARQNLASPLPEGCFDIFQMDLASDPELHIARLSGELGLAASPELVAVLTAVEERTIVGDLWTVTFLDRAGLRALRGETADREVVDSRCAEAKAVRGAFSPTGTELLLADLVDRDGPYPCWPNGTSKRRIDKGGDY
jgi:hypothetical protein